MNNATVTFLVRLSHQWFGIVLAATAVLVLAATVAVRNRNRLRSADSPRAAIATLVAFVVSALATFSGIMLVLAFMHLGCAAIVGQRSVCKSNLRQIGAAVSLYAQDYDERLPLSSNWADAVSPNLKRSSALADEQPHSDDPFRCPAADIGPSYAFNSTSGGISFRDVAAPGEYVLMFDAISKGATPRGVRVLSGGPELFAKFRHSSSNVLFLDGHTKWQLNDAVTRFAWKPQDVLNK